jgi:predicted RNase H-like HicB family nuclease
MPIADVIEATVDLAYSNLTERWYASLLDIEGEVIVYATGRTRADALRNLADAMEDYE